MANFKTDDLVKGLNKAIKSAESFLAISIKTKDAIKITAQNITKFSKGLDTSSADGLKKFNAELAKTNDLVKLKTENDKSAKATQKELIVLQKKKTELTATERIETQKLKVVEAEKNKQAKLTAKTELGLIDAYGKKAARLTKLRREYKSLILTEGKATKQTKALKDEVNKLDKELKELDESVGQNQRSVGDYSKAVKGLNATIGKLGIAALIAKGVELLTSAFGDSREGALSMEIAMSKLTETAKVFAARIVSSFGGFSDLFSAIGDSFSSIGVRMELMFKKIDRSVSILPATIKKLDNEIAGLNKELENLSKSSISDALDKIKKGFDGTGESTTKAIESQKSYLELQLQTKIEIERQTKALAGLQEKRQILQDQSDDDTLGFITRAKFVKLAEKAAIEFGEKELKLAKLKEKLTFEAVKQDLKRNNIDVSRIKNSEQLIALLEKDSIARKVSDANDEAFSAAYIERIDRQRESESFKRDQEEKFRKTARDDFEQELDILEEFTEKKVASNALIVADDTKTLAQRKAAADENIKLTERLFKDSIDLIIAQGKASIDLRADLTVAEKEEQKAMLDSIDLQKILNTQNANELFILLRKLDLGEIEEKRGKETLKIKKDLVAVNEESAKLEIETIQRTKELQEDILLQQRKLNGEKFVLDNERLNNEKKNLRDRIALLEKDSIARLELERELNELLLEDQVVENDSRKELLEEATDFAIDQINKLSDHKKNALQRELDQALSNQETIQRGIENGSKLGEQSLAREKKVAADREAEIKRLENKALKLNALIALLQVWGSTGDVNEALTGFATVKAAADTVDSASYEGTDYVGSTNSETKVHNGKDGHRAALHTGEIVLNNKQSEEMRSLGFGTRDSMLDLARMSDMGVDKGGNLVNIVNDNALVVSELKEQNELLKKIPKLMPIHNTGLTDDPNYIKEVVRVGNVKESLIRRANTGWARS